MDLDTLVAIVRDLAARHRPYEDDYLDNHCTMCSADFIVITGEDPQDHDEDCPWRRACELVAKIDQDQMRNNEDHGAR